jgi:hypothetical protein
VTEWDGELGDTKVDFPIDAGEIPAAFFLQSALTTVQLDYDVGD